MRACRARTIGPIDWPAVTHVNRSNDGNWMLSWLGVDHGTPTAKAIGIRFGAMRATYGPALDLKTWSANFADSDTVIGDYLFSSDSTTDATWIAGNDFRIEEKAETRKPAKRSTACCYNLRNIGLRRASGTPADSKRAAAATRTLADMI